MSLCTLEAFLNWMDRMAMVAELPLIIMNKPKNGFNLLDFPGLFIPEVCIQLSFFE